MLTGLAPWDDRWLRETWQSPVVGDTVDSMLPSYLELRTRLLTGDLPLWSNLAGSGTPLLASTNIASLTPSTIWMLLAPTWWAIGFAKLIQLAMGLGGMTLWLRRLGTSWAAGALAGVLYCTSGFIVAWSGWLAQSGVAATIPLLFWAIERFIALRTVKAALLLSLIVAWLLLGGFPAVAGHALYAGAAYFLVRCTVEHRLLGWRRVATTIAGGTAAVLLGIGLSAVQVVPLLMSLAGTDTDYRNDQFDREQPVRSLLSVALPRIFNFGGGPANGYGPDTNPIEAYAFLGLGAVALALLAVLAGRFHGVARGAVPTLAMVGALAAALVWKHGFWTDWLSDVPVFAGNDAGRLRDLVALTGCALAGIGFNLLFLQDLPQRVRRRLVTGAWVISGPRRRRCCSSGGPTRTSSTAASSPATPASPWWARCWWRSLSPSPSAGLPGRRATTRRSTGSTCGETGTPESGPARCHPGRVRRGDRRAGTVVHRVLLATVRHRRLLPPDTGSRCSRCGDRFEPGTRR